MYRCVLQINRQEREGKTCDHARSPYVIAALGNLSFCGLLPPPKKRLKLMPRPLFFSSGGETAFASELFLLVTLPFVIPLAVLVLLPLTSLGRVGAFSVPSDFVAGDRFSVPGVVTVRLGLSVVLRPLVAEGVEGASGGWFVGRAKLGEVVRWVKLSLAVFAL
jgi:hypothetical protein